MRIYCIGCSHTEGAGLADNLIFPNEFPGDLHRAQVNNSKWNWTNKRTELLKQDPMLFEKLRQENLKRSWPAKLEQISGYPVVNGGVGGASIASMAMTLIHDLEIMAKDNELPTVVLIGLTGIARIPILNKNPIKDYMPLAFKNIMPASVSSAGAYKDYCESYLASHSDEELLTFYLYHCLAMRNTVKAIIGKDPIFVKTVTTYEWKPIVDNSQIFLLKQFWKMLDFDTVISRKGLESFVHDDGMVLPDGHYKEYVHQQFAEYIHKEFLHD